MKYILPLLFSFVFLLFSCESRTQENAAAVPILMYHNFTDDTAEPSNAFTIALSRFDAHLTAREDAGYHTVTFADLIDYVYFDGDLPEQPILITSDDGYTSVLDLAAPCAADHGMTLSCSVIGALAGVNGHFSFDTPVPANVEIVSHTFALHDLNGWNGIICPDSELLLYERLLTEDCARMNQVCGEKFPQVSSVLVYPHGSYSAESERIVHALGYTVTVTCNPGIAEVRKGEPESLYTLPRISVWRGTAAEELLELIEFHKN